MRNSLIPCVLALLVASCGGGGGSGPAESTISGTAATGAPLGSASVDVKCRAGTGAGTTDAAGRFEVRVAGAQAPCLLKASGQGSDLVSVLAASGGTANVTSLTHLLAARLLRAAPAAAFGSAGESTFAAVTEQGISAAQGEVTTELLRMGAQMPSVNWVTQPFTAAPGDAMDGALELLKSRLDEQNKTLDAAAVELSTGPLQGVTPPSGVSPTCVPGMIAGFDPALQDALRRVVSQPNATGGGDGPGGVGAGDGGADGGVGGVGVGGSLGQFTNVDVTVQFASGTTFGPTRVDTAQGTVTLVPCDLPPPVLVTFTGAPGSGAQYFDEQLNEPASFEGQTMRGILRRLDRSGGVTPFTEAMVRRTLLLGGEVATDGGHRLKVIEKAGEAWTDPARVQIAHDEVLKSVNDLLPGIYRLEDLTRLPVLVNAAGNEDNSAVLTDNQNGVYGAVLGGLAKAAARAQPASATPALAIQQQLADDLEDGVLDLRRSATPVAPGTGAATYHYEAFAARLTNETGATAKALGAGALKTRVSPVQRLKAKSGTTFGAQPNWTFTLLSDGTLQIVRTGGAVVSPPTIPAGMRFSRIDVFDRSIRTPGPNGGEWQNCLVATSIDGQQVMTWQVGVGVPAGPLPQPDPFDDAFDIPAKLYTVGAPGDPVTAVSPESLSADQAGGDSIMFVRRSGDTGTVPGCDQQDQHPGLATEFGGRYVVQVQQDFGNRYVVYSDGRVEAWGINKSALGINDGGSGNLSSGNKQFVVSDAGGGAQLTGVAMLSRGQNLQQTRALIRSADPARDGKVLVWGEGMVVPRPIGGLDDICWIAGPYAVSCSGQLFYAEVTGPAQGNEQVAPVAGVTPIWRVSADFPIDRDQEHDPNDDPDFPDPDDNLVTQLVLSYNAIAQDGTVYRLSDATATPEQ